MGTKTMQMARVETSAGVAICAAPSRMACSISFPDFEVAVDVLDLHGRIVHQNADGQRQAAQGHDVDGLVQGVEHHERAENGKRNGDRDNQRGTPTAQEDQDHDGGEAGGDDGLADHAVDGAAHKDRLVRERVDAAVAAAAGP